MFKDVTNQAMQLDTIPEHCVRPPLNVYIELIAETIKAPQEIWYEWTSIPIPNMATVFTLERDSLVRRYLTAYNVEGENIFVTVITTTGSSGWVVRDAIIGREAFDAARCGNLAYREAPS